jgi:hypothetical protein
MSRVVIYLDFEHEDPTSADVANYLYELLEDGGLDYVVLDEEETD